MLDGRNWLKAALAMAVLGMLMAGSHHDLAWAGGFGALGDICLALLIGLKVFGKHPNDR